MPKLTFVSPRIWDIAAEMDGQPAHIPFDDLAQGFTIEVDGPIYVTLNGRRIELRPGVEGWATMREEAGDY